MSRKNKKYRRQIRQNILWPLAALGGILVVAALLLLARRGGDGGGVPSIAVDRQTIEYGDVKLDTGKTFAIKVTNTGDGTLRFKEEPYIEVIEGC